MSEVVLLRRVPQSLDWTGPTAVRVLVGKPRLAFIILFTRIYYDSLLRGSSLELAFLPGEARPSDFLIISVRHGGHRGSLKLLPLSP